MLISQAGKGGAIVGEGYRFYDSAPWARLFAQLSRWILIFLQCHQLGVLMKAVAATDGDMHQAGNPVEKAQAQEVEFEEAQ